MRRFLSALFLGLAVLGAAACVENDCGKLCTRNGDCSTGQDCIPVNPLDWDSTHVCMPRACNDCVLVQRKSCNYSDQCVFLGCK